MIDIKTLLQPGRVITGLDARGQRSIMAALAAPLVRDGVIIDEAQFLDDLQRRESQITTQVEEGIAFPHARSNAVRRLGLVVGVAKEGGLAFGPDPCDMVRMFFLIAIPAYAPTAHLPLLQRLASFAHAPERRARLFAADTPGKVVRCLASFKK